MRIAARHAGSSGYVSEFVRVCVQKLAGKATVPADCKGRPGGRLRAGCPALRLGG
jgi:hypothetical protein